MCEPYESDLIQRALDAEEQIERLKAENVRVKLAAWTLLRHDTSENRATLDRLVSGDQSEGLAEDPFAAGFLVPGDLNDGGESDG